MFLPVTPGGLVPVTAAGEPVLVEGVPGGVGKQAVVDLGTLQACLCPEDSAGKLGRLESATFFADQPLILQAIALIRNRREQRFDPRTGRKLDYPAPGIVGCDPDDARRMVFPRLDPAVIGLIRLAGTDRILLARNRRRNSFFSLIAGYVEPGETAEAAFAREALEETGRRVEALRYWGSQSWPPSGSLMLGFCAQTADVHPTCHTDGELEEIRWVERSELPELSLPRPGSIAHTMIMEWYHGD
ncbi:NAD(+) diphosphatase [Corynebacterium yonathiae]|uniref:NAD(+) diphosphatase n=1 Tax=Corynebacterium yonathiae TaxID=2913504 RepID=A0A9X3M1D9_9CORY|nr:MULTISPECIES: NAD(+) diphosphatase [Corynebacterium]MCZ9296993.1 NUDIX domain-containing protein [Corynebacterium yonathiae]MDK2584094.1 NAD(+) diphosphatase [Corynebacterium sp. BWA136]